MAHYCRLLFLLTCFGVLTALAQEQPVFRVGSELVVVDLVVADRSGRPVSDLAQSEVQVFEDGRLQKIEFLRRLGAGTAGAGEPAISPAAASEGGRTASAAGSVVAPGADVAIVLDLGSMPLDAFARTRETIARLLRDELPPAMPVMIATIGPAVTVRAGFTLDRTALLAALEAIPPSSVGSPTLLDLLENAERLCDTSGGLALVQSATSLGRSLVAETRARMSSTSEALGALSRSLASRQGRKHLVYFSAGYYMNPAADAVETIAAGVSGCTGVDPERIRREVAQDLASANTDDLVTQAQTVVDRANRSQVSFYAVDPRGLVTSSTEARQRASARGSQRGVLQKVVALDQTRSIEYLETLAAGTGGRAFVNSNDIARGLRRAWLDASEFYLIGYAPAGGRRKGRLHKIEVKVSRPGLDLLYRNAYYEATELEVAQADVATALSSPSAFQRPGFDVQVRLDETPVRVVVFAPPAALTFAREGTVHTGTLSVHATLRDASGRLVGGRPIIARDFKMRLDPDRLAKLVASDHVEIPFPIDRPGAGVYRLTVVARDSGGWIAAHTQEITLQK